MAPHDRAIGPHYPPSPLSRLLYLALVVAANGSARSLAGPTLAAEPTISGPAVVGGELFGNRGLWQSTKDITYSYQWLQCKKTPRRLLVRNLPEHRRRDGYDLHGALG